ncbi:RES family NAD+ phosphorylase [Mucilaginibacter robiniae]|uniref:RES family NAD+ phosphorylase n=1 Tax=Mucilaginibacter robiniae TaxID=2728022 RepID=A0A7L5E3T6_9SPHI|nr:RES domain-containing protein [Mucilaginibacter robiniae]QJD97691.1 RES family NAD+ phosphorylase [Mucilaginibacter robiniae]
MLPEITLSDLKKRLDQLKKLNLSIISYPEIIDILNKEIILPILVTEVRAGNFIERIRINKGDEIFTTKQELSYRTDLENIKSFGRANSPGSSMFYGAVISSPIQLPRIVALAETDELLRSQEKGKVDKDILMTVSKWKITKNMRLAEIVFKKNRIATTPEIEKAYQFHLKAFRKNMPEEEVQKLISILEFYSEEFSKAEITTDADYKISAAYAESAFKTGNVQGIIYPSVRTDYEGSNVALLPKTVDEHLQFEEALIIHVQIRKKKVFLDNLYRTGIVATDTNILGWYKMESASEEVKNKFFGT